MDDVKILICCHKKCDLPQSDMYLPIQVGSTLNKTDLGIQKDDKCNLDVCDNISYANNIYCEMTGMYWAWKNIKKIYPNTKYIGLCHYRRYFNADISPFSKAYDSLRLNMRKMKELSKIIIGKKLHNSFYESQTIVHDLKKIEDCKTLYNVIKKHDIIYTNPIVLLNSNVETMFELIGRPYISLLKDIVKDKYNDYYNTLEEVLAGNKLATANMIIISDKYFDDYCNFIFTILDNHIKETVKEEICKDPFNEKIYGRVSGYLSEILTFTYIRKKEKENVNTIRLSKYFVKA